MRRPLRLPLLAAVVVALGLVVAGGVGIARTGTGCTFAPAGTCLRVLFIGNSYTSVNDLPATVAALMRAGGGAVETRMIAPGGAFLDDQVASPAVGEAIRGGSWTVVVLQEQSQAPASGDVLRSRSVPAATTLAAMATATGARAVLFQTWAHRDGWPEAGMDEPAMAAALAAGYDELANATGAAVARVGDAWQRARELAPGIELWQADGSHPTPAGTYLAACVLVRELTGRSPVGLGESGGVSSADAATLQGIAALP